MPFTKPTPTPTPAKIGQITIEIEDMSGDANKITVHVGIETLSSTDAFSGNFNGDLLPHLTTAQRNGIINLLSSIRTKAQAELL